MQKLYHLQIPRRRRALFSVFAALAITPCLAAPLPIPNSGDALRSLERPTRPSMPITPSEPLLPEQPLPAANASDGATLQVQRLRVEGNTRLPEQAVRDLLQPWENRQLSFADLQRITLELTRLYRDNGYLLAQAYLPAQDVQNGDVLIQVLEGHVADIAVRPQGALRLSPSRIEATAREGAQRDQAVHATEIERALLLLNDMPGIDARATLEPGRETGTADLGLSIADQPLLGGGVQLDNYGLESTGEYRIGGELRLLDPLGIGDQLNLRALTSERSDLANGGVDYSLPLGHQGTRLRLAASHLEYELGDRFEALDGYGRATVFELGVSHPLIRQRQHTLNLHAGYAHKRLTDVLDAVGSDSRKRIDLFNAGFSYQRLDGWQGITSAHATWSEGRLRLLDDAERFFDGADSGLGREGRFSKLEAGLSRIQPLAPDWRLFLGVNGQRAFANLDSVEKFSLGGPFGPRAYPLGEASGDHGWLATAELQWQLRDWLALSSFLDHGWVRYDRSPSSLDDGEKDRHLHAYGLSATLGRTLGPQLSASLAWPGSSDSRSDPDQDQPRLYVALGYRF